MPAAFNSRITRGLTSALCGLSSRGAKNTPATLRAMHCRQSCSACSSLVTCCASACAQSSAWPARSGRRGDGLADRLEDLGLAEIRNDQAENQAVLASCGCVAHIGAGAGDAIDQSAPLQLAHGAAHCDPRHAESLHQRGFAGELLARPIVAADDIAMQLIQHDLVFRPGVCCGMSPCPKLLYQLFAQTRQPAILESHPISVGPVSQPRCFTVALQNKGESI